MALRGILKYVFLVSVTTLSFSVSLEEKYPKKLRDRSEDIIKAQDEEEPLLATDVRSTLHCKPPDVPDNGLLSGTNYNVGATIYVRCNEGYHLVGPSSMTCLIAPDPFNTVIFWDPNTDRRCEKTSAEERSTEQSDETTYMNNAVQYIAVKNIDDIPQYISRYPPKIHWSEYKSVPVHPLEGIPEQCQQEESSGMCKASFQRFFFNIQTMECQQFTYRGCGGNGNNFRTIEECEKTCLPNKV